MKAKEISGQAPGGKRTPLAEALPLDTPFVVQIFPFYGCNFRCGYCIFSVDKDKRHFISDTVSMDLGLFRKAMDDMTAFPQKIKVLRFVGIGEPLLHKKIAEMVKYATMNDVANVIEVLTNASLLTPEMSDQLIAAGLTRLVVSIQGTSKAGYKKICGADMEIEKLIDYLRYFYMHKGKAQMYIKIIDCALTDTADEKLFYRLFGDICDTIAIEHAVPIHSGVDFNHILRGDKAQLTQFGQPIDEVRICPQPFFTMQLNPDGNVVPCYSFEYPRIIGNVRDESICDIWNGKSFQRFRREMLDGMTKVSTVCAECNMIRYRLFPEDRLNDAADRLKKMYPCQ